MMPCSRTVAGVTVLVCMSLLAANCGRRLNAQDYDETVRHAAHQIPQVLELERVFPQTKHFITHYDLPGRQWYNAEVYIDGGYSLTIQVEIDIDYATNTVTLLGETEIYFLEYESIEVDQTGRYIARVVGRDQHVTDDALWRKFIASDGDVRFLGVKQVRDHFARWEEYIRGCEGPRMALDDISIDEDGHSNDAAKGD